MNEDEMKSMLGDLAEGVQYECKPKNLWYCSAEKIYVNRIGNGCDKKDCHFYSTACCGTSPFLNNTTWRPYKLGEEIRQDWEYRRAKWYVAFSEKLKKYYLFDDIDVVDSSMKIVYSGSKDDCEKWVETMLNKRTWLDERKSCLSVSFTNKELSLYSGAVREVCKKILSEMEKLWTDEETESENYEILKETIEKLGVNLND